MKAFVTFIYVTLALSAALLAALLGWKIVVAGERPGMLVLAVSALLVFYVLLSLLTLAAIKTGRGATAAKIWIMLFAFVFFYAILDIVGGMIFLRPEPFVTSPDSYVHHKMLPNKTYLMYSPFDFELEMTTNSMGFRGREIGEKQADVYRIIMLGDSFTLGEGVTDEQTSSYVLESILNGSRGRRYEVVNLAVPSYTPILEYLTLKARIETLKPDLVIMNFDMSDHVGEYVFVEEAGVLDEEGNVIAVDGFPEYNKRRNNTREKISAFVRSRLFLTGALIQLIQKLGERDRMLGMLDVRNAVETENFMMLLHTLEVPQLPEAEDMYAVIENSILRTRRLCEQHGSGFILATYPWAHQVSDDEWIPGRRGFVPEGAAISDRTVNRLEEFSAKNGIVFFNAFPEFRAYSGDARLYYGHDMHWTRAGHKLYAESLAGFLEGYFSVQQSEK